MRLPSICLLGLPSISSAAPRSDGQRSPVAQAFASLRATPPSPPLVPVPDGEVTINEEDRLIAQGMMLYLEKQGQRVCDLSWEALGPKLADLEFTDGLSEGHIVRRIARGLNGP